MENSGGRSGPHARIRTRNPREQFLAHLLDRLWERYRSRVPAVGIYERLTEQFRATFVNDHIAFRTFANQRPLTGIASLSRIFEALGYGPAGLYTFPDKHLQAIHYQHPHPEFPKLFISELQTWKLPPSAQETIERTLADHRTAPTRQLLSSLEGLSTLSALPDDGPWTSWLDECAGWIEKRPWGPPNVDDLTSLDQVSQYAAWVLVHGYNVNHFTALINSHGVEELRDIERTVRRLREAGVSLKPDIEGEPGSILRQTATAAATEEVEVTRNQQLDRIPWTYAYFELAERGEEFDPRTGANRRFEGFLGAQATQLFEMTRRQ